jgi:hypothetical protein
VPDSQQDLTDFVAKCETAGKRVFFTSRSAMVAKRRCPRSRFLRYCYDGRGLQKIRMNVPLSTGIYTHLAAKLLLTGTSPLSAAEQVLAAYDEEVRKRGLDLEASESLDYVAAEQRAICEAFVWLLHLRVIPELLHDYEIIAVEKDDWFLLYEDAQMVIIVETRGDAIMRERLGLEAGETGDLYVLNWKTTKQWDSRKLKEARIDMQSLSEAYSTELRLNETVMGVKFIHLIKGKRFEDDYRPGTWTTRSPLIRPWYNETGPSPEFAWSYEWSNPEEINEKTGRAVKHRLGKGWRPCFIPEVMPMREWIEMLHSQTVQPEAGDCLRKCYVTPMPERRNALQKKHWLRQVTGQELEVAQSIAALEGVQKQGDEEAYEEALDLMFPQYEHSCCYPSECDMFAICHGGEGAQEEAELTGETVVNPLSLYQPRAAHHPGEYAQTEED